MYYINSFFIYSVIGFILESTIYKFIDSNRHSGIFYGPITPIYGIGALIIIFLYNLIYKNNKINKYVKPIILFFSSIIILTIIEFIGGNLISIIFDIDLWDYSTHKFHIGKYISLTISLCWGILSLIFVYIIKPFIDRFIKKIPRFATYLFIITFIIDLIAIIIFKKS